jgi:hypothetical protein
MINWKGIGSYGLIKIPSRHFTRETEENDEEYWVTTASVSSDI